MNRLSLFTVVVCAALIVSQQSASALVNGENIAPLGLALQSSTRAAGGAAERAIDGNTDGNFGNNSVTHTNNEPDTFWEVDLGQMFHIDTVRLHNRTGCCQNRLSNFDITVLDDSRNEVTRIVENAGIGNNKLYVTAPSTEGQFLRIQFVGPNTSTNDGLNNDNNGVMSLAEVQIFGGELENLARNALSTVSQSTTRVGGGGNDAFFAVDGITDGVFNNGSVTHTLDGANDNAPTWELDLGVKSTIDEVVIFNRTDCCSDRLTGAEVSILDLDGDTVFSQILGNTNGLAQIRLDTGDVNGNLLRIQLPNGSTPLSLAEVQVFGAHTVPEPTSALLLGLASMGVAARRRRRNA